MSKKRIAKNYIYNMLYEILVMIIPLITTPYLSRVLGAENIGIYSFTISITTYFILFGSLGVAMYGKREIAYVQDYKEKRSNIFYEILFMRFITLGLSIFIFYITFCIHVQYLMYYKILLLELFANCIDISWFFQGLEEFKKTVIRNVIVKLISVICIFLFVKTRNDLTNYFFIYVLSTLLGNFTLWLYLPKYIHKINFKSLNLFRHLKPTLSLFIPQVATQIYTVLDKTMIGAMVSNKSEVGFYEQAQKIIKLLMTLATSLGTVMLPRIAATYAKGDKKKIKEYMNQSFAFIMMLAFPLMLGIISVSSKFVPVFYGKGYEKVIPLLCIISPIIVFIGLSNVTGTQYLLPTKQQKKYTISVIIGAIVNFILNFILIRFYKSIGASIATVIAELAVTTTQFILVRKEINIKDVFKISYRYVIASLIMFICSVAVGSLIHHNILSIILQVGISSIVYFGLLLVFKDKLVYENIQLFIKKRKNSKN